MLGPYIRSRGYSILILMRERAYYCLRGVYETKKYFVELSCSSSFHHAY